MSDVPEDFATAGEVDTAASDIGSAAAAYAEAAIAAFEAIKNGPLQVLDSQLAALYLNQSQNDTLLVPFAATMQSLSEAIDASAGYVTIDATAKDHDGAALLAELQAIGLVEGGSFGSMASGLLPISQISKLVQLSDLSFARESGYLPSAGLAMNQGDHAMLADLARASYGVDGSGIKIGILSDSFNNLSGMSSDIASGDLPVSTTILQDLGSGGTDEGRAMAQLAHDIAPGAAIAFATAYTGIANFANNILALAASGARVIVDDIFYYAETAYQDGPIAQAIDQVTANGVAYFTAAGNDGHLGFEASFVDSGATSLFAGEPLAKLTTGAKPQFLPMTVPGHTTVTVVLEWNQPAASVSAGVGSQSDVDLFVYNSAGTTFVTPPSVVDNIGGDPFEMVQFSNNGGSSVTYNLAVGLYAGAAPTDFKLMVLDNGAGVTLGSSSLNTNTGTIYGHAAANGAIAIGAAYYQQTPAYGMSPPVVESYSSYGPTRILFDTAGNALASADIRQGPDIVAADGGDTTFFGSDSDGDGKPNFFGTSAAAPDAAAVAALMLQANTALNASDIRNLLSDSAIDMNDPATAGFDTGFDSATGYGLIQASKAVQYAATHVIALDSSHGVIFGTHLNDVFTGGSGNHSIAGGNGADTLDYGSASGAVNVNLASGSGSNGFGGTDNFSGIEKLIGSSNGDTLSGGLANDTLAGGAGADSLAGGAADDVLTGGAGNDSLDGNGGVDTAIYSGLWANYLIVKSGATSFSITDKRAGTPDGADTILNVETLSFTDLLAIAAGAAVTPAIVSFADDGGIAGDFLTNDSNLLLSGNAGTSSLVNIFDGGVSLGTAGADVGGAWSFQTGVLGSGLHSFTAAATDGSHWGALSSAFSVTLDITADGGGAASLLVNDTADHSIDRTEAASVQFTIAGLDSDATAIASFTDGTHIVQVGGITANGAYAANLTSLDGGAIHTSLAISDVAGNQATIAGNDVQLASFINEPPTAFADTATALEAGGANNGTPGVDPAGNVLVNDTDPNSGDTKTVQGVAAGAQSGPLSAGVGAGITGTYGTLLLNANGSYAYTLDNTKAAVQALNAGGHLSDVFTYTMHDTAGAFSTATLTVTVDGADDAPAQPQDSNLNANSISENAANGTAVGITASATDIDGGSLTYSLADNAGGRFTIDPVSGVVMVANGSLLDFETSPNHTIVVQVSDGVLTSSQNFAVALTNVGGVTITGKSTGDVIDAGHTVAGQPFPTGEEDNINGASGADSINALGGNDTINGGSGGDTMAGAAGDDLYIVDSSSDLLIENPGEGTDSVQASVNFVLGINFENLTLTGSANLGGTGNAAANIITGNSGNNLLAGLGGGDTLDGGAGLDTATYVSSLGAVTVSLSNGTGTGGDAQGDLLSNIENLTGSAFGDCLQGDGAGNSLIGNDGGDTLDGGAGADSMAGGLGDDTYIVDSALDLVTESSNQGVDTIVTAVNYTLPNNLENLAFSAVGAFVGSGNSNPNMIVGGGADDSLSGLSGNDTLDGGAGADTMVGGANDDTYWMDNSGDQIVEASNGGTDTILFLIASATLAANTENLTFAGTGDATATGNILANILIGGAGNDSLDALDGNDTLDGNAGADHMAGGLGNDLYKVDNAGDQVIEASGGGTDTVLAALNNYVLAANLENLSFVGAGNFTGAGNILANAITGGAGDDALNGSDGNDTLDGGAGGDSLTGGLGNDTFIVDSATDVVVEAAGAGTDTVKTTLTNYLLAANVEALTFTGILNSAGTGNDLANTLTGGSGHDTLDGGIGNDKVLGGLGDDQLLGGSGNDSLTGGAGADTATGGAGADRFIFAAVSDFASGATLDSLADFTHALSDKIDVSGIDANAILAGNQAFSFIGAAGFSSHAGELDYVVNGADVIVSGDTDGNGVSDFSFKVVGVSSLVVGDFIL